MQQSFTKAEFEVFQKHLWLKKTPGKAEKAFREKTIRYSKYIKWIPGLEMLGIWNSIAMNGATQDSDIDLYIVTSQNRMWLVRILVTLIFQILGVRKTESKHAWRFCLSFFSTREWMDFKKFALDYDPYLYFWVITFQPIINKNLCYESFLWVNNSWADIHVYKDSVQKNHENIVYKWVTGPEGIIWNFCNKICRHFFLPRTLAHFEALNKPYGIIINQSVLKFHNADVRKDIAERIKK